MSRDHLIFGMMGPTERTARPGVRNLHQLKPVMLCQAPPSPL